MRTFANRKAVIAVASCLAVATIGGGAAYAYWTVGGAGTGSAVAGSTTPVAIQQTGSVTGLAPGAAAAPLAGTFTNPNSTDVFIEQVQVSVAPGFLAQDDASKPACTAADFTITQPSATHALVHTGSTWSGGSIAMVAGSGNQDNCKNITVPLVFASN